MGEESSTGFGIQQLSPAFVAGDRRTPLSLSFPSSAPIDRYRYTEWVEFNTKAFRAPDFLSCKGVELYDHTHDPGENTNLCGPGAACTADSRLAGAVAQLAAMLHHGPLTGGGWGPWSGSA